MKADFVIMGKSLVGRQDRTFDALAGDDLKNKMIAAYLISDHPGPRSSRLSAVLEVPMVRKQNEDLNLMCRAKQIRTASAAPDPKSGVWKCVEHQKVGAPKGPPCLEGQTSHGILHLAFIIID